MNQMRLCGLCVFSEACQIKCNLHNKQYIVNDIVINSNIRSL